MTLAVGEEHRLLEQSVRSFLADQDARGAARAALNGTDPCPEFFKEFSAMGWLGLHVPEQFGGSGYGLAETAIVLAELGRACAPGPFLTCAVASSTLAASDAARHSVALHQLATGMTTAGVGLHGTARVDDDKVLNGSAGPVVWGEFADLLIVRADEHVVLVDPRSAGVLITSRANLDPTRPTAEVEFQNVQIDPELIIPNGAALARSLLRLLASAEAAGGAAACREMAAGYAKLRTAFGRPIGQFQAVKHHCVNILVSEELATSAVWDAARASGAPTGATAAAAAAVALPAFLRTAKLNLQVHGGIGFTWEHDAHLYLRRAGALQAAVGSVADLRCEAAQLAEALRHRHSGQLALPQETEPLRAELRSFRSEYLALPAPRAHQRLVEAGYLFPHWPKPWGRAATPLEQLVIEQELGDITHEEALGPNAWTLPIVLPTIIRHGTVTQQTRWMTPTLLGTVKWCQMFSEPGAGSDLASVATRATRGDGGWKVSGQKVWTSHAQYADLGLALVRTDPNAAKNQQGITCMVIDMRAPGVTVRPLRQITGSEEFNEVFLDDVFVPDQDVVGEVNSGWTVARTTLSSERISLGDVGLAGEHWEHIENRTAALADAEPTVVAEFGDLVATALAIRAMNVRAAAQAVAGEDPGIAGNIAKLLSAEHLQRLADFGIAVLGEAGCFADGAVDLVSKLFLASRMTTIAGGTSEIVRNVIGEHGLGLPREPSLSRPSRPSR